MNCDIPLHLADGKTYLAIFGPFVLVLGLVAYAYYFGKAPTTGKRVALGLVVAINVAAATFFVWQARSARIAIDDGVLLLKVGIESVNVQLSALRWDEASDATSIRFTLRKFGTSLPGMQAGWFRKEGGGDVFLLRSSAPSTLISTTGTFDIVIPTKAYVQASQCVPATTIAH